MKNLKSILKEEWFPEIKNAIKEFKNPKTRYRQIPNLLTTSRLLSPLVIIPVALTCNIITTFIVASLFALTDAFDGMIARKYKLQSKLGAMLDPVTDKFFALGLLLPNMAFYPLLTSCFLICEAIISVINTKSTLKENKPSSNLLGKTKTTFLSMTSIAMYLSSIPQIRFLLPFLSGITIGLELSSAVTYKMIDLKKDNKKKQQNIVLPTKNEENETEKLEEYTPTLKEQLVQEREQLITVESQKKSWEFIKK